MDIKAWLMRDGAIIATLGTESPYDLTPHAPTPTCPPSMPHPHPPASHRYNFNYQRFKDVRPEIGLRAGDTMRVECVFNTLGRSACTYFY